MANLVVAAEAELRRDDVPPGTADELIRPALLEQGVAVAVMFRRHHNLIAWKERGLFVRVDRATYWGTRS